MTVEKMNKELGNGAFFVVFLYCFSLIIVTFKGSYNINLSHLNKIKRNLQKSRLGFYPVIPNGLIY